MDAVANAKRPRPGFTLLEMLTVIVIIGILAGFIGAAAVAARNAANRAVIDLELNQLDMALKEYKQEFGDYPPDFRLFDTNDQPMRDAMRQEILRHVRRAFPQYLLSGNTDEQWQKLRNDILIGSGGVVNIDSLDAGSALPFWLGGMPAEPGSIKLIGFIANPGNPFDPGEDLNGNGQLETDEDGNKNGVLDRGSRLPVLFEFDPARLRYDEVAAGGTVLRYYPPKSGPESDPYVYFRARQGSYFKPNHVGGSGWPNSDQRADIRTYPCLDTRVLVNSNPGFPCDWANPKSFQIRAPGLDGRLGNGMAFPEGEVQLSTGQRMSYSYDGEEVDAYDDGGATYDDQANFCGGTFEDKIP